MNVVFLSPNYPAEIPFFVRGLAAQGARVWGVGDQPEDALPREVRARLAGYLQIKSLLDEEDAVEAVCKWLAGRTVERVEALWEPLVLLAARMREALDADGHRYDQIVPFRDKNRMKEVLSAAGIRTARHARARSLREVRDAADHIGYPIIIKPIAGAGSQDTYRIDDAIELERTVRKLGHVPDVAVEEFIEGDEYTYDTVCANGRILFDHIAWYRPRPLIARHIEWITPQIVSLRDIDAPHLRDGRAMGHAVLRALGHHTGFTHMEWFRKADGEVVFNEIAARPAGSRSVDAMNYACDIDLFTGWAEAVMHGRLTQPVERRYNAALMFKRAQGAGRIQRIDGQQELEARFGPHIVALVLPRLGTPRGQWREHLTAEGWMVVRHPDLELLLEIADTIGTELQLYAW